MAKSGSKSARAARKSRSPIPVLTYEEWAVAIGQERARREELCIKIGSKLRRWDREGAELVLQLIGELGLQGREPRILSTISDTRPRRGRPHTPSWERRIVRALKARPMSWPQIQKFLNPIFRHLSVDAYRKMAQSQNGRKKSS